LRLAFHRRQPRLVKPPAYGSVTTTARSSSEIKKIPHQAPESVTSPITTTPNSILVAPILDGQKRENRFRRVRLGGKREADWIRIYTHWQKGKCWLCKKTKPRLDSWHHLDHDPSNWDPANIRRVHRSCNTTESNLYRSKFSMGKERENTNISWESQRSLESTPTLELECRRLLEEYRTEPFVPGVDHWIPTIKNMADRLRKIVGLTQQPILRWIDSELQPEGFLTITERTISDGRRKRTAQVLHVRADSQ